MMLTQLSGKLDSGLRQEVSDKFGQTGIEVLLTPDWKPEKLIVHGVRVADGKPVELVNCAVREREIACKGLKKDVKLKNDTKTELFYSSHFPLLLRSLALRAKTACDRTAAIPLVELRLAKDGAPELFAAEAKVVYEGDEVLAIGDNRFNGRKFSIASASKTGTFKSTVWLSGNDVVIAAQNQDRTLQRVLMSRFKKYSDF